MPHELLVVEPRRVELASYEEPPLQAGELRAEAIVSGISHGTELATYRGSAPFHGRRFDLERRIFVDDPAYSPYPARVGYEWVGVVTEQGTGVEDFAVGDLVTVPRPHRHTHTVSAREQGRFAPARIPQELDPEAATLLQPARIALAAVHDAAIKPGDQVVVFGLGVFGQLAVQLARLAGAGRIDAADPIEPRRRLAETLGADRTLDPATTDVGLELRSSATGRGADVAIEFSGSYAALQQALRSVRLAGRVVAAGFYQGSAEGLRLGEEWHHNRLTLISSMSAWDCPHRDYPAWDLDRLKDTAAGLLVSGRLETSLPTQRFPFDRAAEAYELIDRRPEEALRVLLTY